MSSQLILSALRCPDSAVPETRTVVGGEYSLGRGPENDWVLHDPDRHLSKRHCVVAFRGGAWQILDTSTNGTFLNRDSDPIGRDQVRELNDGDRIRLGAWEIEARIEAGARSGLAPSSNRGSFGSAFDDDPLAPGPGFGTPGHGPSEYVGAPAYQGGGNFGGSPFGAPPEPSAPAAVALPMDFDPLKGDEGDDPFTGPTRADHSSALSDSFRPPTAGLPDDWDLDSPLLPSKAQAPLASPSPTPFTPPPVAPPLRPNPPLPPTPMVRPTPPPPTPTMRPTPVAPPPPPVAPTAPPKRAPVATSAAPDGSLLAAFLHGAGMPDAQPADAAAMMEELGRCFRALVTGLRGALLARAEIKTEFRIERTMIRAEGNNPLKFAANDEDALAALLGAGRRADMAPTAAVTEALNDIRLHELAVMNATQAAVRALLARFDPARLREEGERQGGILPAQKLARAFEVYERLHGETVAALADDFDSVFGKAFARAYEQAQDELAQRER